MRTPSEDFRKGPVKAPANWAASSADTAQFRARLEEDVALFAVLAEVEALDLFILTDSQSDDGIDQFQNDE